MAAYGFPAFLRADERTEHADEYEDEDENGVENDDNEKEQKDRPTCLVSRHDERVKR